MTANPDHPDPHQKQIVRIYAALGAGLLLSVLPFMTAAFLSLALIFGALVAAYILRSGMDADGLLFNHMTYIIRTIWIVSLLATITTTAGAIYLFYTIDNTPLDPCIQKFMGLSPENMMIDVFTFREIFGGCYTAYWKANIAPFLVSGVISAGPVLVYFLVRYARGLSRALNGYRIAHPQAWF